MVSKQTSNDLKLTISPLINRRKRGINDLSTVVTQKNIRNTEESSLKPNYFQEGTQASMCGLNYSNQIISYLKFKAIKEETNQLYLNTIKQLRCNLLQT